MIKTIFCFLMITALGSCLQLTEKSWKECESIKSVRHIDLIDVTPCDAEPCAFTRGQSVKIQANFDSHHNTQSDCVLECKAQLGGWVEIFTDPVCSPGTLNCPLVNGNQYTINYQLSVSNLLPSGLTQTRWKLLCNGKADEIFCAEITVDVK